MRLHSLPLRELRDLTPSLTPARSMSSMDSEEKLVLNHIRDAGNMGALLGL